MYEHLLFSTVNAIASIVINRPAVRNALNASTLEELSDAVERVRVDDSIRAAIITGSGDRAFVAGADIGEITGLNRSEGESFARRGQAVFNSIEFLGKPVIAAVNGPAAGGGASLALACDLRIASSAASIGAVFTRIGLHPDLGATYLLPLLAGFGRAMELVLTGDMVSAVEAHRIGLFNRVVPPDALAAETHALARTLAERSPTALARTKLSMHAAVGRTLEDALARELTHQLALIDTDEVREALKTPKSTR